jgi:hypothetical protein
MASHWLWALALGIVVAVGGAVASRVFGSWLTPRPRPPVSASLLGLALAGVAFVLCLPTRFPFSPGNEMAYGGLLGMGAAVIALVVVWLSRATAEHASQVAGHASLGGVALTWAAVTHLLFPGDPTYALVGGASAAMLVLLPPLWLARRREEGSGPLEFLALAIVLLALASLLSVHRHGVTSLRPYWAVPAIAMAAGLLGSVVAVFCLGPVRAPKWGLILIALTIAAGVWLGGGFLLHRVHDLTVPTKLTALVAVGWVAFALAAAEVGRGADRLSVRLFVPLLGVVLFAVGFNLAGAYGVSVALAAGLALSLPLGNWRGGEWRTSSVLWLAAFGVLYLAYRLFLENFGSEFRAHVRLDVARHYVLIGIAAGMVWTAAAWQQRPGRAGTLVQWGCLVLLPAVLFVVFGYEALLGLLLGMLLGQLMLPALALRGRELPPVPPVFLSLAALWALIIPNWAHFLLQLPRWTRGTVIGVAAVVAILLLGILRQRWGAGTAASGAAEQ